MAEVPRAERGKLLVELARQGHILKFKRPDWMDLTHIFGDVNGVLVRSSIVS